MEPQESTRTGEGQQHAPALTVTINNQPVVFLERKATGSEIKATAIAQGVQIQSDFVLFEVKDDGVLKQIGDAETVQLHPNQRFRAVGPDDNS